MYSKDPVWKGRDLNEDSIPDFPDVLCGGSG
jgi:hypothetical protein